MGPYSSSLVLMVVSPQLGCSILVLVYCGPIKSRPVRGVRREKVSVFFFSLFLRNNKIIKCLKHCVRFKLTTEDIWYKDFEGRGTNTYERDEKKKEKIFFTKPSAEAFLLP
jgi:hypothetical protein